MSFAFLIYITSLFAQWTGVYNSSGSPTYAVITTSSTVLAGSGNGLVISSDDGNTWTEATWNSVSGMPVGYGIHSFTMSGATIFAGANSKVLQSSNNGSIWTLPSNTGFPLMNVGQYNFVNALMVSGSNLFAATDSGLYVSNNNANNWARINSILSNQINFGALAQCGTTLFTTASGVLYKSIDNGSTWSIVNTNFPLTPYITCLAVIGTNIFAGTYTGGAYLSQDNGNTWNALNTGSAQQIDCFTTVGNNLFSGFNGASYGVFLSTNNGSNWAEVGVSSPSASSLALSNTSIFAANLGGGVYRMQTPLGIDDAFENANVSIYPNPSNGNISIDFKDYFSVNGCTIKITNLIGQPIFSDIVKQQKFSVQIPLSNCKGIYFVNIADSQGLPIEFKKIVIE